MAAGNEAQRSDRIEYGMIRSLHFVTLPAAIHKITFDRMMIHECRFEDFICRR